MCRAETHVVASSSDMLDLGALRNWSNDCKTCFADAYMTLYLANNKTHTTTKIIDNLKNTTHDHTKSRRRERGMRRRKRKGCMFLFYCFH